MKFGAMLSKIIEGDEFLEFIPLVGSCLTSGGF